MCFLLLKHCLQYSRYIKLYKLLQTLPFKWAIHKLQAGYYFIVLEKAGLNSLSLVITSLSYLIENTFLFIKKSYVLVNPKTL